MGKSFTAKFLCHTLPDLRIYVSEILKSER